MNGRDIKFQQHRTLGLWSPEEYPSAKAQVKTLGKPTWRNNEIGQGPPPTLKDSPSHAEDERQAALPHPNPAAHMLGEAAFLVARIMLKLQSRR